MMTLRVAGLADVPALQDMIESSVRGLSPGFYTAEQIEAALADVFGVDSQLIADGTRARKILYWILPPMRRGFARSSCTPTTRAAVSPVSSMRSANAPRVSRAFVASS
jgi:hypothetical protein